MDSKLDGTVIPSSPVSLVESRNARQTTAAQNSATALAAQCFVVYQTKSTIAAPIKNAADMGQAYAYDFRPCKHC